MNERRRRQAGWAALTFGTAALLAAGSATAQSQFATDISLELDGMLTTPRDVVTNEGGGAFSALLAGSLPEGASLAGYHVDANGDVLYVSRIAIELPGSVLARRQDVVRNAAGVETIELDGLAAGIPETVGIDCLSANGSGDLLLSFDRTVEVGGITFGDEDLAQRSGAVWSLFFDGSGAGIPEDLNTDGCHYSGSTNSLFLSFGLSGSLGGVSFDDEDVVEYGLSSTTWSLAFDASAADPALAVADVIAVPEPSLGLGLVTGLAALGVLARRRRTRRD